MIVLDTNIVSETQKTTGVDDRVRQWVRRQDISTLYLCAPVVAELSFGAERVMLRDRCDRYIKAVNALIKARFAERVLPFDVAAARHYGTIRAKTRQAGQSRTDMDLIIAAICLAHGAAIATRNVAGFAGLGVTVVNPFAA